MAGKRCRAHAGRKRGATRTDAREERGGKFERIPPLDSSSVVRLPVPCPPVQQASSGAKLRALAPRHSGGDREAAAPPKPSSQAQLRGRLPVATALAPSLTPYPLP